LKNADAVNRSIKTLSVFTFKNAVFGIGKTFAAELPWTWTESITDNDSMEPTQNLNGGCLSSSMLEIGMTLKLMVIQLES